MTVNTTSQRRRMRGLLRVIAPLAIAFTALPTPLLGAAAPAQGSPASTPGPIESVTLYRNGQVEVERRIPITVQPGRQSVTIDPLPGTLQPHSIRVGVDAHPALAITNLHTERRTQSTLTAERERELQSQIDARQRELKGLDNEAQAAQTRLTFIHHLRNLPSHSAPALLEQAGSPEELAALWTAIGEGALETRQEIQALAERTTSVRQELEALQRELDAFGTDSYETVQLRIELFAAAAADLPQSFELSLRYTTSEAHWQSEYTAHLDTEQAALRLERRVEVRQKTGEPWDDVELILATTAPNLQPPPPLTPWWINLADPQHRRPLARAADETSAAAPTAALSELHVKTLDTGFTTTLHVPGRVSIDADNTPHHFLLAAHQMPAELHARIVPQQSDRAWLYATAQWPAGQPPLPPGPLTLLRDGSLVGESRLTSWPPGDERALHFGTDPRVTFRYQPARNTDGETGWLSGSRKLIRHYEIELTNHHDRALPIAVRYRLPVARDGAIEVKRSSTTPTPSSTDVEGTKGVLEWRWEMAAGSTRALPIGFEITYPSERTVHGL